MDNMDNMNNFEKQKNPKPLWKVDQVQPIKPIKPIREKKNVIGYLLFFLAFFSLCFKLTLDYTALLETRPEMLNSIFVALSIACSMGKILTQRYSIFRLVCTLVICILIGYSSLVGINYTFLLGFLLIIGMQGIEFNDIVKTSFFTKIVSFAIHIPWYILVYFTNPSSIRFSYRTGGNPRHNFFMGHANLFTAFLVWTCLEFIYMNYKRLNIIHMAVIWLINVTFYMLTDSNSGVVVLTIVTILVVLDKLGKGFFDKTIAWLAKYIYSIFAVFFPFTVIIYPLLNGSLKDIWNTFNKFLTGRLWYGVYAFYAYGATLFGIRDMAPMKVYWSERWFDTLTIFDNYYIGNFVSYGIIHSVLTAVMLILIGKKTETREKIIIIAFSFYGIMEAYVTNVYLCFALLIIGKYLYKPAD